MKFALFYTQVSKKSAITNLFFLVIDQLRTIAADGVGENSNRLRQKLFV